MTRKALTQQQIVAAAAGVTVENVEAAPAESSTTETPAAQAPAPEGTAAAPAAPTASAPAAPSADLVSLLQQQLSAANERVVQLSIDLSQAQVKLDAQKPQVEGLRAVVVKSLSTMKVALGHSGADASALSVDALLAEHASASDAFQKAFKVGGVAAAGAETTGPSSETASNPSLQRARLAAVRVAR